MTNQLNEFKSHYKDLKELRHYLNKNLILTSSNFFRFLQVKLSLELRPALLHSLSEQLHKYALCTSQHMGFVIHVRTHPGPKSTPWPNVTSAQSKIVAFELAQKAPSNLTLQPQSLSIVSPLHKKLRYARKAPVSIITYR